MTPHKNRNVKREKILATLFVILIASFLFGTSLIIASYIVNQPTHIEEVKCYDRYGNEILNQVCEEEVFDSKQMEILESSLFLIMFTFPLTAFIILLPIPLIWRRKD